MSLNNCHRKTSGPRQRSPGQLSFGEGTQVFSHQGRSRGRGPRRPVGHRAGTPLPVTSPTGSAVCLQGARAGLSGDRGVTDLSSAGAHHRLLLSRPPPRRTVRTLLEKQNWGVRHRGLPSHPTPALGDEGPSPGQRSSRLEVRVRGEGSCSGDPLALGTLGKEPADKPRPQKPHQTHDHQILPCSQE